MKSKYKKALGRGRRRSAAQKAATKKMRAALAKKRGTKAYRAIIKGSLVRANERTKRKGHRSIKSRSELLKSTRGPQGPIIIILAPKKK